VSDGRKARFKVILEKLFMSIKSEIEAENITHVEMLALLSYAVGACISMQDQRTMSKENAMDFIIKNIEGGNREAIENMYRQIGGTA
jgi:molybdenum cofactor biosynthesis enzyme